MRPLQKFESQEEAVNFSGYLNYKGIPSEIEEDDDGQFWTVWCQDEDRLADAMGKLQEFLQKKGLPLPVYQVVNAKQVSRSKFFVIQILIANKFVAEGIAPKKSTAEQQAAESALAILRNQNSELQ